MKACCVICLCHITNGWTIHISGDFVVQFLVVLVGDDMHPERFCPNGFLNSLGCAIKMYFAFCRM